MSEEVKKNSHPNGSIPRREADLMSVATAAVLVWRQTEKLTLIWTDVDDFEGTVEGLRKTYEERGDRAGERRIITKKLDGINTEINNSLKYLKLDIAEKFGEDEAESHYLSFGIEKVNKAFAIPEDGDKRLQALKKTVEACRKNEMWNGKYSHQYWDDVYMRYAQTKEEAQAVDGFVSRSVAAKAKHIKQIRDTLNALIKLIRANYPGTEKEEMRRWGFQKEKY
jgi:hypothetical protein